MNLIELINDTPSPITFRQLRQKYPDVSFPANPPAATLAPFNVYPVTTAPVPEVKPFEVAQLRETPEQVDGEWTLLWDVIPLPQPEQNALVNAERDRRVLAGRSFDVANYGPIEIAGDDITIRNLQALAFAAQLRLAQGDTTTITPFRDETDTIHQLVPAQIIDLWSQGSAYVSALFQAAWTLKDNPAGIPSDYKDDKHWP